MNKAVSFKAPWAFSLKITTVLGASILIGIPALGMYYSPGNESPAGLQGFWIISMILLPLAILFGAVFFMIRGYELDIDRLYIKRPGWKTEVDLKGLQAVEIDPEAMKHSIRTFGNGGLFGFSGMFRNKRLGPYRAFATDPKLAVVLKFKDKVFVVTPDNPGKFAEQIKRTRTS